MASTPVLPSKPAAAPGQKPGATLPSCFCSVQGISSAPGRAALSSLFLARANPPVSRVAVARPEPLKTPILLLKYSGTQRQEYKMEGNIVTVFAKFRSEGKATIRLRDPSLDITISKADPEILTAFLDTLFLVHTKPADITFLPSLASVVFSSSTAKIQSAAKRKITAEESSEVPRELAPHVDDVTLCSLGLVRVPACVQTQAALTRLDLHDNRLTAFPDLSRLHALASLDLSGNQLEVLPPAMCPPSLRRLLLANNRLRALPGGMVLPRLETLDLSDNRLTVLPAWMGSLANLRELRVARNALTYLPGSFFVRTQRFTRLDLAGNPFSLTTAPRSPWSGLGPLPLVELCYRAAIRGGLASSDLPDDMAAALARSSACGVCAGPCVDCYLILVRTRPLSLITDEYSIARVPVLVRVCSTRCHKLF
eukprot:m.14825 g.14825  ORF g.14825 m.14825 type:complete len:425 (-) comp6517_c0_seq1:82-1356(-)